MYFLSPPKIKYVFFESRSESFKIKSVPLDLFNNPKYPILKLDTLFLSFG